MVRTPVAGYGWPVDCRWIDCRCDVGCRRARRPPPVRRKRRRRRPRSPGAAGAGRTNRARVRIRRRHGAELRQAGQDRRLRSGDGEAEGSAPEEREAGTQAAGGRAGRCSSRPTRRPGGNVLYVFIIDPAVKGADYTVSTILAEAISAGRAGALQAVRRGVRVRPELRQPGARRRPEAIAADDRIAGLQDCRIAERTGLPPSAILRFSVASGNRARFGESPQNFKFSPA